MTPARRSFDQASTDLLEFAAHMRVASRAGDDALADAISECAELSSELPLEFFLDCVPDLPKRSIPLDAAIEAAAKSLIAAGRSPAQAFIELKNSNPALLPAIAAAELLAEAMKSTGSLALQLADTRPLTLPCHLGQTLPDGQGRYLLHQMIGVGSQGAVYMAIDRALSEPSHPAYVAVKRRFPSPGVTSSAWNRGDEATTARRVIHPNVVRTLDRFINDDGAAYIVQEFVRGGSLDAWRSRDASPIAPRKAAEIISQVARGVQAAHGAGLIHRDIKPSNILMTENGVPKVADFGIAAAEASARSVERQGSLAFVAPEQYRLEPVTTSADVYALGGVLYWLLTGRNPNGQTPEEAVAFLTRRTDQDAPSPAKHRAGIDRDLDAICRRALSPDRALRYGSADALANDLDAWLRKEVIPWNRPTLTWRSHRAIQRSPVGAIIVVASFAVVLSGTAWSTWSLRSAELAQSNAELTSLQQRRTNDEERFRHARVAGQTISLMVNSLKPDKFMEDWIVCVTALESSLGPYLLAPGPDDKLIWAKRVDLTRRLVNDLYVQGRQDEFECLLWESSLCLWLLRDDQAAEAKTRLDAQLAVWRPRLKPGDPWIDLLELFQACAEVQVQSASATDRAAMNASLARAEASAARIPKLGKSAEMLLDAARRAVK